MKKIFLFILIAATATVFTGCNKKGSGVSATEDSLSAVLGQGTGAQIAAQYGKSDFDAQAYLSGFKAALMLDTTKSDASYRAGLAEGAGCAQQIQQVEEQMGVKINKEALYKAIAKSVKENQGKEPNMEQMQKLGMKMQSLMQKAQMDVAKKYEQEGNKYIAQAKNDDKELKTTKSGLVYKFVKKGNGKNFKDGDKVMVKYTGTHIDGTVFDESGKTAAVFTIGDGIIKGWQEILKLMSPGAKVHVIVPSNLAYGPSGSRGIKPNETLVFDIETGKLATTADEQRAMQQQSGIVPVSGR